MKFLGSCVSCTESSVLSWFNVALASHAAARSGFNVPFAAPAAAQKWHWAEVMFHVGVPLGSKTVC